MTYQLSEIINQVSELYCSVQWSTVWWKEIVSFSTYCCAIHIRKSLIGSQKITRIAATLLDLFMLILFRPRWLIAHSNVGAITFHRPISYYLLIDGASKPNRFLSETIDSYSNVNQYYVNKFDFRNGTTKFIIVSIVCISIVISDEKYNISKFEKTSNHFDRLIFNSIYLNIGHNQSK